MRGRSRVQTPTGVSFCFWGLISIVGGISEDAFFGVGVVSFGVRERGMDAFCWKFERDVVVGGVFVGGYGLRKSWVLFCKFLD